MEQQRRPNNLLRQQRVQRGWSQARVAERLQELGGSTDSKLVGKWERGVIRPSPFYQERLCLIYGVTAEQLGLISDFQLDHVEEDRSKPLQSLADDMLTIMDSLENEGVNMDHSRRSFLQLLGHTSVFLSMPAYTSLASSHKSPANISSDIVGSINAITQNYRTLQRAGLATEDGLRNHITLIQGTLENTHHEGQRRELWRNLAQAQLLARHSVTKKTEFMKARTWNEAAIASAQYSGDRLLLGASLGHLGHLYLRESDDLITAQQLIEQAQTYVKGYPVGGWMSMVAASVAAKEGKKQQCESSINNALEIVYSLPEDPHYTDLYYTDFNITGTNAFVGNSFLQIGEPAKALERLLAIDLEAHSKNRHASTFYDIARAHIAMGELEAAETYATRSIDVALTTDHAYIIPRFIHLAQKIQQHDPNETHAASISEYAHYALVTGGIVA